MAEIVFDDNFFMAEALKEAQKAYDKGEVPVGAIVVNDNIIIARAGNTTEELLDVTAHAEILAYTSAASYMGAKYLTECTLYVTLEPCVMCAGALYWAQLKRLVFGASDTTRGFTLIKQPLLHPSTQITKGVMQNECENLIKNFFLNKRL